jgi:hypothetical protein
MLRSLLTSSLTLRAKYRPLRRQAPLRLETLEDRTTPAAVFWDGGGDGVNWTNPLNWSNDALPGPADDVTINAGATTILLGSGTNSIQSLQSSSALNLTGATLTVSGTTNVTNTVSVTGAFATLMVNGASEVQNLTQTNGTINGAGNLTIDSNWTWSSSGTMTGTGHTILNGTGTLGGTFAKLDGRVVDNFGTASIVAGNSLTFTNGAIWNNKAGSLFLLPDSASLSNFFAGAAAFNNAGTLRKTGPVGTAAVGISLNNTGTVDVQVGTLALNGDGAGSGLFTLATVTALSIGSAGYVLAAGANISGAGVVQVPTFDTLTISGAASVQTLSVTGGTVAANADLAVNSLTFSSGTITGPGTITINGPLAWSGGTMSGAGTTTLNDGTTISATSAKIDGRTINNFGTTNMAASSSLAFSNAAIWNNQPGGLFVMPDSAAITSFFAGSTAGINNFGALQKIGPPSTANVGVALNNSGLVQIQAGTLNLTAGGTNSGTFDIASGATLNLGGNPTFQAGAAVTGAGAAQIPNFSTLTVAGNSSASNLLVNGGTLTANAPLNATNLTVNGTVNGTGAINVSGNFNWQNGVISGAGALKLNGTSTMTGGFFSRLDGKTVNNAGRASVALGNSFTFANGSVWNNLASGVLLLPDSSHIDSFFPGSAAINNFGTLRKTAPGGLATISIPVNNRGLVALDSGALTLNAAYVQSAGSTVIAAGCDFIASAAGVQINGGDLTGDGRVVGTVVNSGGTVRPGSGIGTLTLTNTYTQTAGGTLAIELGATGYDRLVVGTTANLGGTLAVSTVGGFVPNFGDAFDVISYGSNSGSVAAYAGLDLGNYHLLVPDQEPTFFRLLTVSTNQAPVIDPIGDQSVDEGGTLSFAVSAHGPEPSETLTYSLDAAPAGASIDPSTGVFTYSPDDGPASYDVTVRVTDNGLPPLSSTQSFTITVNNVAPTAAIVGSPAASPEGTEIDLTATATDPSSADTVAGFSYAWGVTKNGDAFASGSAADFHFTPDDNGTYVVTLNVTDKDGGTGMASATIDVTNVAPTAAISGPSNGVRGQTRTFTLAASDVSPVDQAAGFSFSVDWGDGHTETVSGPSGLTLDHVYADAGAYTIQLTATDKDGGSGTAQMTITIAALQMQGDTLVVGGTSGDDSILVLPAQGTSVLLNGERYDGFTGVQRVIVFGQDGDDVIQVTGGVGIPAELYGGAGDDVLIAGSGGSLLDGGSGDDVLRGGLGRDLLIGGAGSDNLTGANGEDILIAGDFMPSARFDVRRTDLLTALTTWNGPADYADRVAALEPFLLVRSSDDGEVDVLTGGGGRDWFLARTTGPNADVLLGRHADEVVTELS